MRSMSFLKGWGILLSVLMITLSACSGSHSRQAPKSHTDSSGFTPAMIEAPLHAETSLEIQMVEQEKKHLIRLFEHETRDASEPLKWLSPLDGPPHLEGVNHLGLILPHHLLAAEATLEAYQTFSAFKPDVIIVLSPNHQKEIRHSVTTTTQTMRLMAVDYAIHPVTSTIIKDQLAGVDHGLFLKEHGLYNHLPFITHMGWEGPLIPLAFARNTPEAQIDGLLSLLQKTFTDQKVLWIASIDFSHYLPASAAEVNDQMTMQWIEKKDFKAIAGSTSDHLDAPSVLIMWLKQFDDITQHWQSNSAEVLNAGHGLSGTSYMIYSGTKE